MQGFIYMTINLFNLKNGINPFLYIGSTKHNKKSYFGSSGLLKEDIKRLGCDNFVKVILFKGNFKDGEELQTLEAKYQNDFNVVEDVKYYNKSLAIGPFVTYDGQHTKNTLWITNGVSNKRVKSHEVNQHLDSGWHLGKTLKNKMKNRIYINNGIDSKLIQEEDIVLYPNWHRGKLSGNQQNKIWICNESERKLISRLDRSNYPDWQDGWKYKVE